MSNHFPNNNDKKNSQKKEGRKDIDFILCHPEEGLIVVEAKGKRIEIPEGGEDLKIFYGKNYITEKLFLDINKWRIINLKN